MEHMGMQQAMDWLKAHSPRIIFLVIVCVAAYVTARLVSRALRKALEKSQIPDASIFVNLARVLIWVIAVTIVLKPVFGVNPMTLFTALGIGGFAVSLGLKDSIANTIGGFQLMFSHVLQPGDMVRISGITGEVQDVTWRQTVVRERDGNLMMIPNSVLNTTLLEKLDPHNEASVTIPFTAKPNVDTVRLTNELLSKIDQSAHGLMDPQSPPIVRLTGFSPAGVTGNIIAYAKPHASQAQLIDAVTRSVSSSDLFTDLVASGDAKARDVLATQNEADGSGK